MVELHHLLQAWSKWFITMQNNYFIYKLVTVNSLKSNYLAILHSCNNKYGILCVLSRWVCKQGNIMRVLYKIKHFITFFTFLHIITDFISILDKFAHHYKITHFCPRPLWPKKNNHAYRPLFFFLCMTQFFGHIPGL